MWRRFKNVQKTGENPSREEENRENRASISSRKRRGWREEEAANGEKGCGRREFRMEMCERRLGGDRP